MKLIIFVTLCVILGVNSTALPFEAEQEFSPFIIGGTRSPLAPYFAFVQYFNQAGLGFFGGGALISNRHVVTAATNVLGFHLITVHLGSANRTAMTPHVVNMNAITTHPEYIVNTRANDIAVIRLTVPVILTAQINTIALPPLVNPALVLPNENEEGLIAGFGFENAASTGPSQFLNRGYQRTIGNTRCSLFFILNVASAFCAEDNVERASGCQGDIGNPFVLSYRRQDVLAGVLSMHPQCGNWAPTAYTRVSFFRVWLETQLQI